MTLSAMVDGFRRRSPSVHWFVAALLLYSASAARTVIWADSSKLTLFALHEHMPSLNPGDHTGWTVLAWIWLRVTPWVGEVAALPLLSALAGALVVGLTRAVVHRHTGMASAADSAAAVVLVAHTLWWSSALTESYTPAAALALATVWLCLHRGRAVAAAAGLAAGLAVATHLFAGVVALPPLIRQHRRWPWVGLGLVLGMAPLWLAVFGTAPDPLTGYRAGGADTWSWVFGAFVDPRRLGTGGLWVLLLLGLNLGPSGVWAVLRGGAREKDQNSVERRLLAATTVAVAVMLATYIPQRVHTMLLFVVVGIVLLRPPVLSSRWRGYHIAAQVLLYLGLPVAAHLVGHPDLGIRQLPYRDNATYFLCPVKSFERGAESYAHELLTAVPERSVIIADFNPGAVLRLVQECRGVRPDVDILPTVVDDVLGMDDPTAHLAARIRAEQMRGRTVVLADAWNPYYGIDALELRYGAVITPLGPGRRVALPTPGEKPSAEGMSGGGVR